MAGKNILLAVVGMSPEVITETLYALHMQGRSIDAIHCITTGEGKKKLLGSIFSGRNKDNQVRNFCLEYDMPPEAISADPNENLHILTDQDGEELDDILSPEDNEIMLTKCLELAWRFTQDSKDAVFFLVAGGRKTMASCLTLAAQFYGRSQDRLFHVLVSPKWVEECEFWFPRKTPEAIKDRSRAPRGMSSEVSINLINIPFPKVRGLLSGDILKTAAIPADLMANLIRDENQNFIIDWKNKKLKLFEIELDIQPREVALYLYIALLNEQLKDNGQFAFPREIGDHRDKIIQLYRIITNNNDADLKIDTDNFGPDRTKLNEKINHAFGRLASGLCIESMKVEGETMYGINFDRSRISVTPNLPKL